LHNGLFNTKSKCFVSHKKPSAELAFRLYYQHNPARIQTCPVNLHYLLHLADSIQQAGPAWCYWAFAMERYCSFLGASVKSRRFPFANIARRIRDVTNLHIIREHYSLHPELNIKKAALAQDLADFIPGEDCEFKARYMQSSNSSNFQTRTCFYCLPEVNCKSPASCGTTLQHI
jgi:hypothetical protein